MPIKFVAIANPDNRRFAFFQQALARWGLPPATLVSYADLIAGKVSLASFRSSETLFRFDSPEKNFEIEKAIIAAGANVGDRGEYQRIDAANANQLEFDKGRILYPRQWYLGWRNLLQEWGKQIGWIERTDAGEPNSSISASFGRTPRVMNHPAEIIQMFDKPYCHQLFSDRGIPVPRSLGKIESYEHLRETMRSQTCHRVFIKLSHSSAASGVVAYHTNPKGEAAITTVERVRKNGKTLLYNSRKIRHYLHREEIADIIDILCKEGVQVEEWLPKARMDNHPFDLRVVAIAGKAQHIVVRLGKSPMTNLHLGSDRGNVEEFLDKIGWDSWHAIAQTCETAAALFPHSLYCGIDVLIYPNWRKHAILEINAFGDLLPGIFWNGMDTYTSELKQILSQP